jgi:hypothetical protein
VDGGDVPELVGHSGGGSYKGVGRCRTVSMELCLTHKTHVALVLLHNLSYSF